MLYFEKVGETCITREAHRPSSGTRLCWLILISIVPRNSKVLEKEYILKYLNSICDNNEVAKLLDILLYSTYISAKQRHYDFQNKSLSHNLSHNLPYLPKMVSAYLVLIKIVSDSRYLFLEYTY